MQDSRRFRIFIHLAAILVSLIFLAPFILVVDRQRVLAGVAAEDSPCSGSPATSRSSATHQIFSSPQGTIFGNFRASLLNSLIIATATVAISITVGVFGAYAFARFGSAVSAPRCCCSCPPTWSRRSRW